MTASLSSTMPIYQAVLPSLPWKFTKARMGEEKFRSVVSGDSLEAVGRGRYVRSSESVAIATPDRWVWKIDDGDAWPGRTLRSSQLAV